MGRGCGAYGAKESVGFFCDDIHQLLPLSVILFLDSEGNGVVHQPIIL